MSKKSTFFSFFFWTKKSQKETFFDILDRKECFLDLKSEVIKNSKKWTFSKGVSAWFLSKNGPYSYKIFFSKKSRKKNFLIFWIENKVFGTPKVKFSQSRKKSTFCKGVSLWFLSKNRSFFICFFEQKRPERKIFFYILDRKEYHLDLKSEVLTKSKNIVILEGVSPWFLSKNRPFF